MKKFFLIVFSLLFIVACTTTNAYNSDGVKTSMRNILKTAQKISGDLESGEIGETKMDFNTLYNEFHMLSKMEAPKGSTEEWTKLHESMVNLSMEGEVAAEKGDIEEMGKILGQIFELQKNGHMTFKD